MALFKPLLGDSSRISTDVTPFHEGYVYFTPDNGGLYVDYQDEDGTENRARVGGGSGECTPVYATLLASGWASGSQTVGVDGVTADTNGVMGVTQDISDGQMEAAQTAMLYITGQGDGTITVSAFGDTPTLDIPVVVLIFG